MIWERDVSLRDSRKHQIPYCRHWLLVQVFLSSYKGSLLVQHAIIRWVWQAHLACLRWGRGKVERKRAGREVAGREVGNGRGETDEGEEKKSYYVF